MRRIKRILEPSKSRKKLQSEIDDLRTSLRIESRQHIAATEKLTKERDSLKKLVREQSEADLLVNAMKAVGIIPATEKSKGTDYFAEHGRLFAAWVQAKNPQPSLYQPLLSRPYNRQL